MQNKDKKSPGTADITMKSELKKVVWPTGKQTIKSTTITIAFVLLISVILIILNVIFDFVSETYYGAILGTNGIEHNHVANQSGDSVSGEIDKVIQDLVSGEKSGEASGEVSGEIQPTESGEEIAD